MSKDVIMPALGMAQEMGTLLRWFKSPGDNVTKGEMLMEVETDKANVEIEAPASGVLSDVTAQPGDAVAVGHVIARIVSTDEIERRASGTPPPTTANAPSPRISPVAARIAEENKIDISKIKTPRGLIQKEDVLAYLNSGDGKRKDEFPPSAILASPKARRLASEQSVDLQTLQGSGPEGAVLAADVIAASLKSAQNSVPAQTGAMALDNAPLPETIAVSNIWRLMVERLSNAWTTIPHFYLTRDVNATRLIQWRDSRKPAVPKITYTDLLVKLVAAALQKHPRVNGSWQNNSIQLNPQINIGLAMAVEEGLVVPVVHNASALGLGEITTRRLELIERANATKLSLNDISGGTFTISNLGMYGVDAFNAIVNPPQAAILAVSRIAERVVPVNHQPSVQPMMTLTLSCDHRVVDGARGAQFLDTLAQLIEEPLSLLD
jgi:pyruvate dehydrogenase E2 component (dihydrolipoyllysine-residue acetyltransferase)